jgi:hypothetical protein
MLMPGMQAMPVPLALAVPVVVAVAVAVAVLEPVVVPESESESESDSVPSVALVSAGVVSLHPAVKRSAVVRIGRLRRPRQCIRRA